MFDKKVEKKLDHNFLKCLILAQNITKTTTCHSCKYKCNDVWALLQHVYTEHGLRISEENLPNFAFSEHQSKSDGQPSSRNQPVLTSTPTNGFKTGRISGKSLTPGSRGNFNLNAFCSERLKVIEKIQLKIFL